MLILKMKGKARSVFAYLNILATTEPMKTDPDWWQLYLLTKSWN